VGEYGNLEKKSCAALERNLNTKSAICKTEKRIALQQLMLRTQVYTTKMFTAQRTQAQLLKVN
jgi:hypothetical protein